ncbi:hypothetical protein Pelo_12757 [Pelomyxa schiedti]|nr:hypothetical protein Pelo_12757 [Pelomyxa schiedti]
MSGPGDGHDFKLYYFHKLTWCTYCHDFIWGVFSKQGYRCSKCKYSTHKRCMSPAMYTPCSEKVHGSHSAPPGKAKGEPTSTPTTKTSTSTTTTSTTPKPAPITVTTSASPTPSTPTPSPVTSTTSVTPTPTAATTKPVATAVEPSPPDELLDLFNTFSKGEDSINPDGVETLCEQLGVAPDDVLTLVLAWKFGAARNGYLSKEEFMGGMKALKCKTLSELLPKLKSINSSLNSNVPELKKMYQYAFDFSKETPEHKLLESIYAGQMISIALLGRPGFHHVTNFSTFLKEGSTKMLNKDQWSCFFDFSQAIPPNFSTWNPDDPWPCLYTDFVDYCQMNQLTG